jgi:hypothetical protein
MAVAGATRHFKPEARSGRLLDGPETGLISLLLAGIRLYTAPSHTETWLSKAVRWQPGQSGSFAHTFPEEPTGES